VRSARGNVGGGRGNGARMRGIPARDIPSYPRARCREHHHYRSIPVIFVMTDARSSYIRRDTRQSSRVACQSLELRVSQWREHVKYLPEPSRSSVGRCPVSLVSGWRTRGLRGSGAQGLNPTEDSPLDPQTGIDFVYSRYSIDTVREGRAPSPFLHMSINGCSLWVFPLYRGIPYPPRRRLHLRRSHIPLNRG